MTRCGARSTCPPAVATYGGAVLYARRWTAAGMKAGVRWGPGCEAPCLLVPRDEMCYAPRQGGLYALRQKRGRSFYSSLKSEKPAVPVATWPTTSVLPHSPQMSGVLDGVVALVDCPSPEGFG